jgi:hypothetical protein
LPYQYPIDTQNASYEVSDVPKTTPLISHSGSGLPGRQALVDYVYKGCVKLALGAAFLVELEKTRLSIPSRRVSDTAAMPPKAKKGYDAIQQGIKELYPLDGKDGKATPIVEYVDY